LWPRTNLKGSCDLWAWGKGVRFDFFRLKKPTDDACGGSFNGKVQAEFTDQNWFLTLGGARPKRDDLVARFVKKITVF